MASKTVTTQDDGLARALEGGDNWGLGSALEEIARDKSLIPRRVARGECDELLLHHFSCNMHNKRLSQRHHEVNKGQIQWQY